MSPPFTVLRLLMPAIFLAALFGCGGGGKARAPITTVAAGQLGAVELSPVPGNAKSLTANSKPFAAGDGTFWLVGEFYGQLTGDADKAFALAQVSVEGGGVAFMRFEGKRLTPHPHEKGVYYGTLSARTRLADLRRQDTTFLMVELSEVKGFTPRSFNVIAGHGDIPPVLKEWVKATERSWWSRYSDAVWIVLIGLGIAGFFMYKTFKPQ
jgi:hypothetical protein